MGTAQKDSGLKTVSWILAYAVWLFIFLLPVIGLVIIVVYLLKNRIEQSGKD